MKQKLFAMLFAAMLLATGCSNANNQQSTTTPPPTDTAAQSTPEVEGPMDDELIDNDEGILDTDPLEGLTRNEYEDLEITAAVLNRMAILPGNAIPVNVKITNNGDKTIYYTQGSGTFEVPQALMVEMDGLQTVLPQDHLGIMTMDFVTNQLEPGESLEYVIHVMAIQPHEEFDNYTNDLFSDGENYIAESEWSALQEQYPALSAAEPGSYTGKVSFLYTVADDNDVDGSEADVDIDGVSEGDRDGDGFIDDQGSSHLFDGPTGYAQAELQITVDA